ncbi:GspH/FimT family pseudopilin [Lysobacter sp. SG-8]|uniref:Type II secretion system protein H n=1 Tax=Marilutibacter penaei TaxID=2759900 RepID=A0A7W3U351_9GAMM|nr:GspH/FimT family pseudopilin [Lysobacter penaei]
MEGSVFVCAPRSRIRGFSLLDLAATLAVLGVVLGIGLPSFSRILAEHRIHDIQHRLTVSLALGRIAAIRDAAPVTVCPSSNGQTCRSDGVWDHGWLVYRDRGRTDHPTLQTVVHYDSTPNNGFRVRSSRYRSRVRFGALGWSGGHNLTLAVCGPDGHLRGQVIVNNAGRPRSERAPPGTPCPD